ncbi:hypothetical protein M2459_000167 [Parabacteroides sp. PF5-5]|uniref:hypothetical protein n=1 Tax=unclassified Parabacteroides TaxID=2649774 RepID=UPI002475921A|nr:MULTISPECIES: hypothetical protein [unclassified Parabacteroides]MDH6303835.1 hypothetical protein [Parabacteroides sp. PH5-39]MDH6314452.1 hypothetical protein [Parabacteroides sp. PF5-13]MDH6318483.1 hypothetical protein [Parabacteroides sp. PH5-13]MDH6322224.1 hypothetical protein [Parabacteroides sp. PH5-8]MDH6325696.1 hypothetical protein [Parabacteroides sp. PH5-41]
MRRIAAHYIFWRQLYRMHYVELSDDHRLHGVFPLDGEIAGTEFYDGMLVVVVEGFNETNKLNGLNELNIEGSGVTNDVAIGDVVQLYRVHNGSSHQLF